MIKTEVVSPCAVAPLPSPGLIGKHGGAQGAGSYHCQAPVMHTYAGGAVFPKVSFLYPSKTKHLCGSCLADNGYWLFCWS